MENKNLQNEFKSWEEMYQFLVEIRDGCSIFGSSFLEAFDALTEYLKSKSENEVSIDEKESGTYE